MKSPEEIVRKLERRYDAVWADEVTGAGGVAWPFAVSVGRFTRAGLEREFAQAEAQAGALERWAQGIGLDCVREQRMVGRVSYAMLSHVQAADVDVLAAAVGRSEHLGLYRRRAEELIRLFSEVSAGDICTVLRHLSREQASDEDFELVCRAAQWFAGHDCDGLTPREVPLEGFHAKWLDAHGHRRLVCLLAGLESLVFKERPRLVRFHYLDPGYLSTGARAHDSHLEGDAGVPAYSPQVVVICENRDSALWFPQIEGGVAVLGDGMAGVGTLGRLPWVAHVPLVLYWGDMDIAGMEILAKYRECGLDVRSMFMDMSSYRRWQRFGTDVDRRGKALAGKDAEALEYLTPEENELYLHLCSAQCSPRRIEQERIPLAVAAAEVTRLAAGL